MSARERIGAILRRAGSAPAAPPSSPVARGPGRRGFTLVEVMIAVGALGLIAVGISQVFKATGDTVRAGRRISAMNAYASLLERQLRDDFAAMTRDGFLLIRNERIWLNNDPAGSLVRPNTGTYTGVPLVPGHDASNRARRADEIVFFANGDFVTKRPPAMPDRVARAPAARIYIGHGLRRDPKRPSYGAPVKLSDDNTSRPPVSIDVAPPFLGINIAGAGTAVNEAASGWTLLRHVTLLAPANWAKMDGGAYGLNPLNEPRLLDGMWQVAGQPAARSIFRSFSGHVEGTGVYTSFAPDTDEVIHEGLVNLEHEGPSFGCGAIDIATTDLTEIRALLHAAPTITHVDFPGWRGGLPGELDASGAVSLQDSVAGGWPKGLPYVGPAAIPQPIPPDSTLGILHAWMRDALPVDSDAPKLGSRENEGGRIRYEPAPPNPLCIDLPGAPVDFADANTGTALQREMERADQLMLSSHNFVPGCSEFIVEWSWGDTHTTGPQVGQVIWHGLARAVDLNGNGTLDHAAGEQVASTFIDTITPYQQRFVRRDGSIGYWWVPGLLVNARPDGRYAGTDPDENEYANIAYNYFGYINPTYRPAANPDDLLNPNPYPSGGNPGLLVDVNNNGLYDADDGDKYNDPETIPWPWPRLVRITMSLVDPSDPTVEQTYQFIFDLPGDPVDPRY